MGSHKKHRKQSKKHSQKKKKRSRSKHSRKKYSSSSDSDTSSTSISEDSSSTSSSSESSDEELRKRRKRSKKQSKKVERPVSEPKQARTEDIPGQSCDIPMSLMSKAMAPMTKEQWEQRQSVVRRVHDPTTGRDRLIKGDGEVIEEIVSRDRHRAINQQSTRGDGQYFERQTLKK